MAVVAATAHPAADVSHAGIGVMESAPGQLHVGILYALDAGEARFCHLAFHLLLRDEPATTYPQMYWADAGLDEVNRQYVAANVTTLRLNRYNIPYGFDSSGACFKQGTLEFLPAPPGKGLTCATFILAYFNHMGFKLIADETWPNRPEDAAWQQQMITRVQEYCALHGLDCADHIEQLQVDVGARRIRPEESAAAVIAGALPPLDYAAARALADEILRDMGLAQN